MQMIIITFVANDCRHTVAAHISVQIHTLFAFLKVRANSVNSFIFVLCCYAS